MLAVLQETIPVHIWLNKFLYSDCQAAINSVRTVIHYSQLKRSMRSAPAGVLLAGFPFLALDSHMKWTRSHPEIRTPDRTK